MAEQTFRYNAPSPEELRALYERTPLDVQTPLANLVTFRKLKQEEEQSKLANMLAAAKQKMLETESSSEMAKRKQDISASKAGLVPSTAIQDEKLRTAIEAGQGPRDIPTSMISSLEKPSMSLGNFRAVARTSAGAAIVPTRAGGLVVVGSDGKEIPYNQELHGEPQPLVPDKLGPQEIEDLTNLAAARDQLVRAKTLVKSEATGPIQARLQDFQIETGIGLEALKGISGIDDDTIKFRTVLQSSINDYIKAITGAQMSEPEARRIMKALPKRGASDESFLPALNEVVRLSEEKLNRRMNVLESAGRRGVSDIRKSLSQPMPVAEQAVSTSGFKILKRRPVGR